MVTFHPPGEKSVQPKTMELCGELTQRAIWIDVFEPTREEELALEAALHVDVPTREEMQQIEVSRRLYREKDSLFMTATVLTRSDTSHPDSTAITFILLPDKLVTLRYANPAPFQIFTQRRDAHPEEFSTPAHAFTGLIDAIVERLADILENTSLGVDRLSLEVLSDGNADAPAPNGKHEPAPPQRDYKHILRRIGRHSDLASRARESLVTVGRLISFFREVSKEQPSSRETRLHLETVSTDIASLSDHATFLSGKVSFLLDATLGLISNEQNAIIKIVSVAAVVFGPPTLVASIYGMNFERMPELRWGFGYPFAIGMMIVAAVLPYLFFKRRGWL